MMILTLHSLRFQIAYGIRMEYIRSKQHLESEKLGTIYPLTPPLPMQQCPGVSRISIPLRCSSSAHLDNEMNDRQRPVLGIYRSLFKQIPTPSFFFLCKGRVEVECEEKRPWC